MSQLLLISTNQEPRTCISAFSSMQTSVRSVQTIVIQTVSKQLPVTEAVTFMETGLTSTAVCPHSCGPGVPVKHRGPLTIKANNGTLSYVPLTSLLFSLLLTPQSWSNCIQSGFDHGWFHCSGPKPHCGLGLQGRRSREESYRGAGLRHSRLLPVDPGWEPRPLH